MTQVFRTAQKSDQAALFSFTNNLNYLHRHLDWRDTLEWLGYEPFWILEENDHLVAALACPAEPVEVAWIRLFTAAVHASPDLAWKHLFKRAYADLVTRKPVPIIASLALQNWYEVLLKQNGFDHYQDIIVFCFDSKPPAPPRLSDEFRLREMQVKDMQGVLGIDHLAFEPIWRLSSDDLVHAVKKSSYCTVLEHNQEVVAYQMSSINGRYGHLGRLAVHPAMQHQRLGFALLQNLLEHYISQHQFWGVTLNTQDTNIDSINLYRKAGFHETGERFPVFLYPS